MILKTLLSMQITLAGYPAQIDFVSSSEPACMARDQQLVQWRAMARSVYSERRAAWCVGASFKDGEWESLQLRDTDRAGAQGYRVRARVSSRPSGVEKGPGFGASEPLQIHLGIDFADIRVHLFPYLSASGAFGQHQRALDRMGFAERWGSSPSQSSQANQSTFVTQFRVDRELKTVVTVWNVEDGVQQVFLTHRMGPN